MIAYISECTNQKISVSYTGQLPRNLGLNVTTTNGKILSAQLIQTAPAGPVVVATQRIKEQP